MVRIELILIFESLTFRTRLRIIYLFLFYLFQFKSHGNY